MLPINYGNLSNLAPSEALHMDGKHFPYQILSYYYLTT